MAEIIIKIGDQGAGDEHYKDSDVLCAHNDRHIRCVHAQHICNHRLARNQFGLSDPAHVSKRFRDAVYQYLFVREGKKKVRRIETDYLGNIISEEVFGPPEFEAELYFGTRILHPGNILFGTLGREMFHGGKLDFSEEAVSAGWDLIENETPNTREQEKHKLFPHSKERTVTGAVGVPGPVRKELIAAGKTPPFDVKYFGTDRKHHVVKEGLVVSHIRGGGSFRDTLIISADDFSDVEASVLVAPEMSDDEEPVMVHKRQFKSRDWKGDVSPQIGRSVADVQDRGKSVDVRRDIVLDDVGLLHNKKAGRPAERIPKVK